MVVGEAGVVPEVDRVEGGRVEIAASEAVAVAVASATFRIASGLKPLLGLLVFHLEEGLAIELILALDLGLKLRGNARNRGHNHASEAKDEMLNDKEKVLSSIPSINTILTVSNKYRTITSSYC